MGVTSFEVAGFRRLSRARLFSLAGPDGAPLPVVVVAGANGSGKTAFLEGLLLALGADDALRKAGGPEWRQRVPPGASLIVSTNLSSRVARSASSPVGAPLITPVAYFSSWRAPTLVGAIEPAPTKGGTPAVTEANRIWRLKRRILNAHARGAFGKPGQAATFLEPLNRAWALFQGDGSRIEPGLVESAGVDSDEAPADLFRVAADGGRICSIDELSSGELELLSLFNLVVFDGFEDGGIVVIDEPELHLHDRWQSVLLATLHTLLPRVQIIVATHSSYLWDSVPTYARIQL
jgi:hypothetical protein